MPPHVHPCPLCRAKPECSDGCAMSREHGVGEPRMCSGCVQVIADVDDLPVVKRGAVTVEGALLTVRDAARAALETRDPADRLRVLCERVDILAPIDPTSDDADTWARTGYVMGALDGWAGRSRSQKEMPPDIPAGVCSVAFAQCWQGAWWVVQTVKAEER